MCVVFASLISISAFVLYNWKNLAGNTHPNVSSWAVWSFISILNFTSYKKMTGNWATSVLPMVDSILCVVTAICALYTGSIAHLSTNEKACLGLGAIAALGWWRLKSEGAEDRKSAGFAQIILQIALIVGGIPTCQGLWISTGTEPSWPWLMWTGSFILQCFAVGYTWKGNGMDFLYPICMTIFHFAVFVLVMT